MALSYVGGTSGGGTTTSYSVQLGGVLTGGSGSSAVAGDIVIVVTGWTHTGAGDPGVTTEGFIEVCDLYINDVRDANMAVAWKVMGDTPDDSIYVRGSNSASYGSATVVHVWRGANPNAPTDVATTTATSANASHPNAPSITPVTAGAVVIACGLGTGDTTQTTMTTPSGMSNGVSYKHDGSTGDCVASIASFAWTSGAYDPAAWTGGVTSTSDSWCAATLVLRPFIAPPPGKFLQLF